MTRELKSWAKDDSRKPRPRLTLPRDLAAMWRLPRSRPSAAPPKSERPTRRLGWEQLGALNLAGLFAPRVDLEVVGSDALIGLETPFIFAVNEAGALDHQLLRLALPRRLRPNSMSLSKSLARGRNVVTFSDEPRGGRLVGEFSTIASELAAQHSVAIVPVGIVGSFRLSDTLKLSLTRRPKVSVRFGAPLYGRSLGIEDVTREVQSRVEQLVGEGELSWWQVKQRRLGGPHVEPTEMPRWRRLWEQAAPRPTGVGRRRIWR